MNGRKQASMDDDARWHRFVAVFFSVLIGGAGLIYLFVLLVDPYYVVKFSLPLDRKIVSISQRFMIPQIVRSRRFDSLIVGTSTALLLDPELLDKEFGGRFANLAMDSARAWEQQTVLNYFMREAGPPKTVLIAIDSVWCDPDADRTRVTFRGFPEWLYDDNPWNDYLYLFNTGAVEIAGRLLGYQFGAYRERVRFDGYHVFVPPESEYDAARARGHIWIGRKAETPPDIATPELSSAARGALLFPALTWLDAALAKLPPASLKILAFMPVHVAAQPWPGTQAAALEAECKARIAGIARQRGAKVIDWRISSVLTRNDSNYWDNLHYRVPIATQIVKQLGAAVRDDRASDDGSYRIVVP
jgi:hypothetical protein